MRPLGKKLAKTFVSLIAKRFPMDDACAVMPFDFSLLGGRGEMFGKREVKKAILHIVKKNKYHFYGGNKSILKSLYIDYRKCEIYAIQHRLPRLQDVIRHLSQELCSNFSKLVNIASCLPASSAAAERVFSVQIELRTNTETGYLLMFLIT